MVMAQSAGSLLNKGKIMEYEEWTEISESYRTALKVYRAAFLAYVPVRDAYRKGEISDEVFLAAAAEHDAALAAFDIEAAKEAEGIEII
jgi:hypothetical protein